MHSTHILNHLDVTHNRDGWTDSKRRTYLHCVEVQNTHHKEHIQGLSRINSGTFKNLFHFNNFPHPVNLKNSTTIKDQYKAY